MAVARQAPLSLRHVVTAALSLAATATPPGFAGVAEKTAETFEHRVWQAGAYNKAAGRPERSDDVPEPLGGESSHSMLQEVRFSDKGFEFYESASAAPLVVPGETRRVTLWAKSRSDGDAHPWVLKFLDGWGRGEVGGRKLEWEISKGLGQEWQELTFDVPADWVQPISIAGLATHNWGSQGKASTARLWVDRLRVQTDLANVDPATGRLRTWKQGSPAADGEPAVEPSVPLLTATLSTPAPHNVFIDAQPTLQLQARSWLAEPQRGAVEWRLTDHAGGEVAAGREDIAVADVAELQLPLPAERYGVYHLDASLQWSSGAKTDVRLALAKIPRPVELSAEQKDASPYGINVHGGRSRMVQTFRDAGIVWFRDYAFNYDWMVRAKGDDKKYAGWPWYPQLVKEYEDAGAMVLACHADGLKPPGAAAPADASQMRPGLDWTRELVDMVLAFPSIRYHELDNEYDLPMKGHSRLEEPIDWENYRNYHDKFGDVLHLLGEGELVAVENGRAGVWPERVRREVASGKFDQIDVINSHHYTGVEPPETNVTNNNTGGQTLDVPRLFLDQLRDATRVGESDGRERQHWLTEFGWDTKAGHVVSPLQQAAYLQRGYLMLHAADVDKGFWFFDLDSAGANNFFDGCGLFTHEQQPKLAYASFAAMTKLLPTPEYVGMIEAGAGTWGYVFRNAGELVAAMWTLEDATGPTVSFAGAKLYDFLANPMSGVSTQLTPTPVFAVGIDDDSALYAQTAYSLDSPYLIATSAGDEVTVRLRVHNNRSASLGGSAAVEVADGWTAATPTSFSVSPGETEVVPLTFRVGPNEPLGERVATVRINEGAAVKQVPIRVRVQPGVAMRVTPLAGESGTATVRVELTNSSESQALDGTLTLQLPRGWESSPAEIEVSNLAPTETRTVEAEVTWSPDFGPDESATVTFASPDGRRVERPLMPGRIALHRADSLRLDGDLSDWPDSTRLPSWLLATATGIPNDAEVRLAWSADGLYVGLAVEDSRVQVSDPRLFWNGDVLELFVDTASDRSAKAFREGHHSFWLVPLPDEGRVYGGQWKRGEEVAETRYDLPNIQSSARRTDSGYVAECLIPREHLRGFDPSAGGELGLNVNLTVVGRQQNREVYWSRPKADGVLTDPTVWGTVELAE